MCIRDRANTATLPTGVTASNVATYDNRVRRWYARSESKGKFISGRRGGGGGIGFEWAVDGLVVPHQSVDHLGLLGVDEVSAEDDVRCSERRR